MRACLELLPSRSGNVAVALLNHPKTLHALSLDMVHALQDSLAAWSHDTTIHALLLESAPGSKKPAFCSGGDVKRVALACQMKAEESSSSSPSPAVDSRHGHGTPGFLSADFFRDEYCLNYTLAQPQWASRQISVWDGLVMGGGVGLSIYGAIRIATERALFAMPETSIGFFPDVGSFYWMPWYLEPGVAAYLALTGQRLQAADLLFTGLATHYIPSTQLSDFRTALIDWSNNPQQLEDPSSVVAQFHREPADELSSCWIAAHQEAIDQVFRPAVVKQEHHYGIPDIVTALQGLSQGTDNNNFPQQTLTQLSKACPRSLQITLEGLRRGYERLQQRKHHHQESANTLSTPEHDLVWFAQDLQTEFRLAQKLMRPGSDFHEGIRAALIDKDGKPQWQLAFGNYQDVMNLFEQPIENEWTLPISTPLAQPASHL